MTGRVEQEVALTILSGAPIWIFGINDYLHQLIERFNVVGVVVDEPLAAFSISKIEGFQVPVVSLTDLKLGENTYVLIAGSGRINQAVLRVAKFFTTRQFCHLVDIFRLYRTYKEQADLQDLYFNEARLCSVMPDCKWSDSVSKDLYETIFNFRSTYDRRYISGLVDNVSAQYFEPFIRERLSSNSHFVDVGGYDGLTTSSFLEYFPQGRSTIYEPMKSNLETMLSIFEGDSRVSIINAGLSDIDQNASFKVAADRSVNLAGNDFSDEACVSETVRLVSANTQAEILSADFIKLDIEGGERVVLNGLGELFSNRKKPIFAIACYHSADDFLQFPSLVFHLFGDGDMYFRHYTESIYESVLYFVPRNVSC